MRYGQKLTYELLNGVYFTYNKCIISVSQNIYIWSFDVLYGVFMVCLYVLAIIYIVFGSVAQCLIVRSEAKGSNSTSK